VLAAAAIICLGGEIQCRLWPRDDTERKAVIDGGYDLDRTLSARELVNGQDVFVAVTGVTTGALLAGVHYSGDGATTDSLVLRSQSGTTRRIIAEHSFDKLSAFTGMRYRS
jgi:fructose-1,6-bisphosphatase II